jgi:prolyl 4-hydroxylase
MKNLEMHSKKPLIFSIDNFLSDKDCQTIINHSKNKMEPAQTGSFEKAKVSKIRTGSSYFLNYLDDPDLFQIFKKLSILVNKPGRNFDKAFQVIHYGPNEFYEHHTDPSPARNKKENIKHRKLTILCYLNDVEEGGETEFPKLNLKISPKKGKIIYFDNYEGNNINPLCLHKGCNVLKGEKWAFNLWYHEF